MKSLTSTRRLDGAGVHTARGNAAGRQQFREQVLLTDPAGTVIYTSSSDLDHDIHSASILNKGIPLLVQGQDG